MNKQSKGLLQPVIGVVSVICEPARLYAVTYFPMRAMSREAAMAAMKAQAKKLGISEALDNVGQMIATRKLLEAAEKALDQSPDEMIEGAEKDGWLLGKDVEGTKRSLHSMRTAHLLACGTVIPLAFVDGFSKEHPNVAGSVVAGHTVTDDESTGSRYTWTATMLSVATAEHAGHGAHRHNGDELKPHPEGKCRCEGMIEFLKERARGGELALAICSVETGETFQLGEMAHPERWPIVAAIPEAH